MPEEPDLLPSEIKIMQKLKIDWNLHLGSIIAAVANIFVVIVTIPIFQLPNGSRIRPMGWAGAVGLASLAGLVACVITLFQSPQLLKRKLWWLIPFALILGLTPMFVAQNLLYYAVAIHHLFPEE